jgi:hypothetical protein
MGVLEMAHTSHPIPITPVALTSHWPGHPRTASGLVLPSQRSHRHSLASPSSFLSPPSTRCTPNCANPVRKEPQGLCQHPRTKFQHPRPLPSSAQTLFPLLRPTPTRQKTRGKGAREERLRTLNASVPVGSLSPRPRPSSLSRPLPAHYLPTGS